jgi:hypothetical protein
VALSLEAHANTISRYCTTTWQIVSGMYWASSTELIFYPTTVGWAKSAMNECFCCSHTVSTDMTVHKEPLAVLSKPRLTRCRYSSRRLVVGLQTIEVGAMQLCWFYNTHCRWHLRHDAYLAKDDDIVGPDGLVSHALDVQEGGQAVNQPRPQLMLNGVRNHLAACAAARGYGRSQPQGQEFMATTGPLLSR